MQFDAGPNVNPDPTLNADTDRNGDTDPKMKVDADMNSLPDPSSKQAVQSKGVEEMADLLIKRLRGRFVF